MVFPGYAIHTPWYGAGAEEPASITTLLPNGIRVGDGVELIELGKRTSVCPVSNLTNGLRVSTSHVSICDSHFAGLVALNPIRYGEVILVASVFDTLDQPFGDGLALDLSAIGHLA